MSANPVENRGFIWFRLPVELLGFLSRSRLSVRDPTENSGFRNKLRLACTLPYMETPNSVFGTGARITKVPYTGNVDLTPISPGSRFCFRS